MNMNTSELQAFEDFEQDWKKRHKASLPRKQKVSSFAAFFWILFWVVVSVGAAVFSAAHTIPAALMTLFADLPYREQLAVTAFVIVEFVIFGAAAKRREIRWLNALLLAALFVAFIGNTSSSIQAVTENGGNMLNQVGGFLLSVIAPITALAAGEVLHIQLSDLNNRRQIAQEDYHQQWKDTESKINSAYTKYEKDWMKGQKASATVREDVRTDSNGQVSTGYGYSRTTDAKEKVRTYLDNNPDAHEMSVRQLAALLSVGKTTVSDVRQEMSNGHAN